MGNPTTCTSTQRAVKAKWETATTASKEKVLRALSRELEHDDFRELIGGSDATLHIMAKTLFQELPTRLQAAISAGISGGPVESASNLLAGPSHYKAAIAIRGAWNMFVAYEEGSDKPCDHESAIAEKVWASMPPLDRLALLFSMAHVRAPTMEDAGWWNHDLVAMSNIINFSGLRPDLVWHLQECLVVMDQSLAHIAEGYEFDPGMLRLQCQVVDLENTADFLRFISSSSRATLLSLIFKLNDVPPPVSPEARVLIAATLEAAFDQHHIRLKSAIEEAEQNVRRLVYRFAQECAESSDPPTE